MKSKSFSLLTYLIFCFSQIFAQQNHIIKVLDATIKDAVVANAEVYIQKNGAQTILGRTNEKGEMDASAISQNDENTLIIIKKSGYSTLIVKCPCWGYTYALSPSMENNDDVRVVLSWGAEPMDVDLHAIFDASSEHPNIANPIGHVYYGNQKAGNISLDVDDRNGFGPETITIQNGVRTKFVFVVRDYTNRSERSSALSQSDARVFLYRGDSLIKTYYVPRNIEGNLWRVFGIDQTNNINTFDQLSFVPNFNPSSDGENTNDASQEEYNNYDEIPFLNDGETAYRARRYDASLSLYRKALAAAPQEKHSLIYNNIALSYFKMAKFQNCILFSQKSLDANSSSTGQTAAASYYNMGLAYEKLLKYREAAQAYQKAGNAYENNTVYKTALKRVRKLIK